MEAREHTMANLSLLRERLGSGHLRSAEMLIGSLHPSEVARLLESLPITERAVIWEMVRPDNEGDVLVELADELHSLRLDLRAWATPSIATRLRLHHTRTPPGVPPASRDRCVKRSTGSW